MSKEIDIMAIMEEAGIPQQFFEIDLPPETVRWITEIAYRQGQIDGGRKAAEIVEAVLNTPPQTQGIRYGLANQDCTNSPRRYHDVTVRRVASVTSKDLNPRIYLRDGVSLSVQASKYAYSTPRSDDLPTWRDYVEVEVGYIEDADHNDVIPPDDWRPYGYGEFPSKIYGYIPVDLVEKFISDHGGAVQPGSGSTPPRAAA